jgi:hypothetical protein
MKRLVVLILVVGLLAMVGFAVRYRLKGQAEEAVHKKREASYELSRREYSQALEPGMNRKEVEDYVRKKTFPVLRMCCVGGSKSDLIKIGQDDASWFCGVNNVFVAFQFEDHASQGTYRDANDSDTLSQITVFHWADNCL